MNDWSGTVVYQRSLMPIWKLGVLVLVGILLSAFTAFKTQDVPADLSCAGNVPVPTALAGARVASKLGGLVRDWQKPIPEDEIRYTLEGTWQILELWYDSFTRAANGHEPPQHLVELETEQSKRQADATDGCTPCPQPGDPTTPQTGLGQVVAPSDAVIGAKFGDTGSWARYHTGLDYRAAYGSPVKAAAAGKVLFAGNSGDWSGSHVAIRHADGYTTMYSHLSRIDVTAGDPVTAGQYIGLVGQTGRAFGPHLHFEVYPPGVKYGDVYKAIDPAKWLSSAASTQAPKVSVASFNSGKAGFDREQLHIAAEARAIAKRRGLPDDAVIIILMSGLVESDVHQEKYLEPGSSDRDSQGWQQQRASAGWGTVEQLKSSAYQTGKFYDALTKIAGWQNAPKGDVAQRIQRSAHPDRYATREQEARRLFEAVANKTPDATPEAPAACQEDPTLLTAIGSTTNGVRTVTDPTSNVTYRVPIPAGQAGVAMNYALDQLGKPYVWASTGPDGFDCSGLVSAAWKHAGVDGVYPQTEVMVKQLRHVDTPQPGDLLYRKGHVQMYLMTLGSGKPLIVEAPRPGKKIRVTAQWMTPTAILRPGTGV